MKRSFFSLQVFLLIFVHSVQSVTLSGPGIGPQQPGFPKWINNDCAAWVGLPNPSLALVPSKPCPDSVLISDDTSGNVVEFSGPDIVSGTGIYVPGTPGATGTPILSQPGGTAGTLPIPNPGLVPLIGEITINGVGSGNYVYVPPGGIGAYPIMGTPGDPSGPVYGFFPLPPGQGAPGGGTIGPDPGGSGGSMIDTGAPVIDPGTGGVVGGPALPPSILNPGNSDNPIITLPPNWAPPSDPTTPPAPLLTNGVPNLPPGYSPPVDISGSNTINFPTPPTTAGGSNMQAGFGAVVAALGIDSDGIIKAIQAADNNNQNAAGGISNGVQRVVNVLDGISNHVAHIDDSTQRMTNQLDAVTNLLSHLTNSSPTNMPSIDTNGILVMGQNFGSSLSNAWTSSVGSFPTNNPFPTDGGNSTISVPIGHGIADMTLTMGSHAGEFEIFKAVISWAIVVLLFSEILKYAETVIDRTLAQRQVQGSNQEILGNSASIATAFFYASVIVSLVVTLPTVFAVAYGSEASQISSFATSIGAVSALPMWGWITSLVPVSVTVTAFFTYLSFRFLLGFPLMLGARAVILLMLA